MVLCMSSFLVDGPLPSTPPTSHRPVLLHSHSLPSLLYAYLHEALYLFATTNLLITRAFVASLRCHHATWTVEGRWGVEPYERARHGCGTEVKAITYSNMQIFVHGARVGIDGDEEGGLEDSSRSSSSSSSSSEEHSAEPPHPRSRPMHGADLYVIVDI